ncbi:MAG TPA: hypothetical protein VHP30_06780 [Ignavibacteriales bacterium]|nr:hypothetical protein [Ignavibacteriales bacterium]
MRLVITSHDYQPEDLILLDPATGRTFTIPDVEFGGELSFKEDGSALFFTENDFNFASIFDSTDDNFRIYTADFLQGEVYKFFEHPGFISSLAAGKNGIYYPDGNELVYIPNNGNQELTLHKGPELTFISEIKSGINEDEMVFLLEYGLEDPVIITSYNLLSKKLTKLISIPQWSRLYDYSSSSKIIIYGTEDEPLPVLYNIRTGTSEVIPDSLKFSGLYIGAREACFYSSSELIIIGSYYSGKYSNDIFIYNFNKKKITRQLTFNGNIKFNLTVYNGH